MATELLPTSNIAENQSPQDPPSSRAADLRPTTQRRAGRPDFDEDLPGVLKVLASLKLTVALFAMAVFIILAGTLAQVEKGIGPVIDTYFRMDMTSPLTVIQTMFVWIDFQIFFPPPLVPDPPQIPGGFPFPRAWLIGIALTVNLLAAHAIRFKVAARAERLAAGLVVFLAGTVITVLVIQSGSSSEGFQGTPWLSSSVLWGVFLASIGMLLVASMGGAIAAVVRGIRKSPGEFWLNVGVSVSLFGLLLYLLWRGDDARLNDSNMRILWQLMKGTFAGLVLLAGCMLLFKQRAGIVLLHLGILVMMFGELLVGTTAVEGRLRIVEGETVNYLRHLHSAELAIIDRSGQEADKVSVIPARLLREGRRISSDQLPFDVEVVKYFKNSAIRGIQPGESTPADSGRGRIWVAEAERQVVGTDTQGRVDMPAAYVRIYPKDSDRPISTHLVSTVQSIQDMAERVKFDRRAGDGHNTDENGAAAKEYELYLRFKRTYKPYSMHLYDVVKEDYPGTNTPRHYGSTLRLIDPSHEENRQVKIWMNNPLRYGGETFYQADYNIDPITNKEYTVLQVVSNIGWMIPYVGCMIVAVGMLHHFWGVLVRFTNSRVRQPAPPARTSAKMAGSPSTTENDAIVEAELAASPDDSLAAPADKESRSWQPSTPLTMLANWILPLVVVVTVGGWLAAKARPPKQTSEEFRLYEFGKIPVVYQGRTKPLDTFARNSLRIISGKEEFIEMVPAEGESPGYNAAPEASSNDESPYGGHDTETKTVKQPALKWLVDLIADPQTGFTHRVIRIDNHEVLDALNLKPRSGYRYSLEEVRERIPELTKQAEQARKIKEAHDRTLFQNKIIELEQKVGLINLILESFRQTFRDGHSREAIMREVRRLQSLKQQEPPLVVPPAEGEDGDDWESYTHAWTEDFLNAASGESGNPAVRSLTAMLYAYGEGDAEPFNAELTDYQTALAVDDVPLLDQQRVEFEAYFNHLAPFYRAAVIYFLAFFISLLALFGFRRPLNRTAFCLLLFVFAFHTAALIWRMYISERPPVTNLYSSAVFIGWGCVLLSLILEPIYRLGVGNLVASVAGFNSLIIAHYLAADGDTITVMRAVLDTNFWLGTHVVCITLGYSMTFVAGLIGVAYILLGTATPLIDSKISKDLIRMMYGTLAFAIFFSFVGTVLGGLWADDSWGRFWGWDPKENGALIIVLWNALCLHARWGGMAKNAGFAALCVGGNIATAWSWFGVNELSVGMHSYGFTDGAKFALAMFVLSQLAIIGVGLIPRRYWMSFRTQAA